MDVHARAMQILTKACRRDQKMHVHCFTGDRELVQEWRSLFPNAYFGYTAAVQDFSREQIKAIKLVPMDRLLLETDSPYMPPHRKGVNTPAFIGDIASLVAAHLNQPVGQVLRQTLRNGQTLYGC